MFVKRSWTYDHKKGKKYVGYQIVESYRPKRGKKRWPKTRTLATITKLGKPLIDKIALLLKSPSAAVIQDLNSFFKKTFTYGGIVFLYLFMKQMKIISCLRTVPLKSRILIVAIILNRILAPRSKLGSTSWFKKTAFFLLSGITRDELCVSRIYKAMDVFYNKMDKVFDNFFQQNKKENSLLLYDVTSIFFEGNGPKLAEYGYSRDEKPNNPQILLALCLNEERLPIYFDILKGNIQDKQTVIPLIKSLKERFSLANVIFVGDRGMITVDNLKFLEKEEGLDYIIALTHASARELVTRKRLQLELFDERIPVTIAEEEGDKKPVKYVLCGSEYRKAHDENVLMRVLEKGRYALEDVKSMVERGIIKDEVKVVRRAQKKLVKAGCDKFYDFTYKDGKFEIIEKTSFIKMARSLCGYYIIKTTLIDMKEDKIEENYKQLKTVERAFRELKELVRIRPIFHWEDRRVKTHIFLCILAQTIVNKIRERLKVSGWLDEKKNNSFESFLDTIDSIDLGIFEIEKAKKEIVTPPEEEQQKLLKIFNIEKSLFTNIKLIKKEFHRLQ